MPTDLSPALREAVEVIARAMNTDPGPVTYHRATAALRALVEAGWSVQRGPIAEIAAERRRQVDVEGWTPEHDDTHGTDMGYAAASYALFAAGHYPTERAHWTPGFWPWDPSWWKPATPRRDLIKAGALIVAEIERLDRTSSPVAGADDGR